jgi:aryl-alcohol dehydrogenase-like predicted oxidoreductase
MGAALKQLGWPRLNYIVSSKYFWGLDRQGEAVNRKDTLNRKYLMQAVDGSLKRFGLDHIDLIYCHRPDPHTPVDETVRAMNDLIVARARRCTGAPANGAPTRSAPPGRRPTATAGTGRWSSSRSTTSSTASAWSRSTRACTTTSAWA